MLRALMQDWPLTVDRIIDHGARWHGPREVIGLDAEGRPVHSCYAAIRQNAQAISAALLDAGIRNGERVATLAMNSIRHLAAWYGIAGIGAVCHTLNPRSGDSQLRFIIDHAEDRILFADGAFAAMLQQVLPQCAAFIGVVFLSEPPADVELTFPHRSLDAFCAAFVGGQAVMWGGFDENAAAGLCYTSGSTGDPKGVLYSHRSNVLHAMMSIQPDVFGFSVMDTILPMVPMYHANAWGIAHSAPMVGARLALPGARLDGASLCGLIDHAGVTVAAGVPTVWLSLVEHMRHRGRGAGTLQRAIIGGAAAPESLLRDLHSLGVEPLHAWGMTELSPVGGAGTLTPATASLPFEAQLPYRIRQGRSPFGIDLRLVGDNGEDLPHDGRTSGALRVRGFAVASEYYRRGESVVDAHGYLDTGDIATIDGEGFMRITDRAKDIVKSGGEWISSQELENAAMLHPDIALAAVVGVPHEKWGERPLMFVQLRSAKQVTTEEVRNFLAGKVASWWLPDEVVCIAAMPLGTTGKIDKLALRTRRDQ